ncbi:putative quinol monooxygenase [Sphingosinicella sp.]|uniref:putative quinol monooxygenase n=1 Tax=Sphingosinicella sp. TaxID=1917971 RepID=UPI00180181BE|nr:putative quinol monooxygenase [Sphingosinicella sp.]MBA4758220.1 antibiotic biosynthesis monooxygenase [Sphingosinicella sp.]
MTMIARQYVMVAKPGEAAALRTALVTLAANIQQMEGCLGTDLLRDAGQPERFVLIERWASIDAHTAGGKQLPKEAFAPVMAAVMGTPEARDLEYLPLA